MRPFKFHQMRSRADLAEGTAKVEAVRVQDVDFGMLEIVVRRGKGDKDRVTPLAVSVVPALREHLERVRAIHEEDIRAGGGDVYLPYALARKYSNAGREWIRQYVFPARDLSVDPRTGQRRRHHLDPGTLDKGIKLAVQRVGLAKRVRRVVEAST